MANVKFQRGSEEKIRGTQIQDGTVSFSTDSKKIFLDTSTTRLEMGGGGSSEQTGVGKATDEGGEIFNDYVDNSALQNSHAEGYKTIAGGKGFRIRKWTDGTTFVLEGYNEFVSSNSDLAYAENDEFSYQMDANYDFAGTIIKIDGDSITVSTPISEPTSEDVNKRVFWVPSKPLVGNIQLGQEAHAEGYGAVAHQIISHAEGYVTNASGKYSHAEGRETTSAYAAHAEGWSTKATGQASHSEGNQTTASGLTSHAEGTGSIASWYGAHAEGIRTNSSSDGSHAEGVETISSSKGAHAEGQQTHAINTASHAEGMYSQAQASASHAEGQETFATGVRSHSEGYKTIAEGAASHAEGDSTKATSWTAHAEGRESTATESSAHAEGYHTTATAQAAHSEGDWTGAKARGAHAEGRSSNATGESSHAEGRTTTASGEAAHSEGKETTALADCAHAEGYDARATATAAHAEGSSTQALDFNSHAEGNHTVAFSANSHAEGDSTQARGESSHASGVGTITYTKGATVVGRYNVKRENENCLFAVGDGQSDSLRHDALWVDEDGNTHSGNRFVQTELPVNDNDVINKKYLDSLSKDGVVLFDNMSGVASKVGTDLKDDFDKFKWVEFVCAVDDESGNSHITQSCICTSLINKDTSYIIDGGTGSKVSDGMSAFALWFWGSAVFACSLIIIKGRISPGSQDMRYRNILRGNCSLAAGSQGTLKNPRIVKLIGHM